MGCGYPYSSFPSAKQYMNVIHLFRFYPLEFLLLMAVKLLRASERSERSEFFRI